MRLLAGIRNEVLDPPPPSAASLALIEGFDRPGGRGQVDQLRSKPEDAEIEASGPPGLFDDLPTDMPEERALNVLRRCAPAAA